MKIIKDLLRKTRSKILLLPFIERPLPKNPFKGIKIFKEDVYLKLNDEALIKNDNKKINAFEKENGYLIDPIWFKKLSLQTQTCIKDSPLNFNHGRILYSLLSKYIVKNNSSQFLIFETGTARGFSSICMAKAIIDRNANGLITTIDSLPHNEKINWNCISDSKGKKSREELLSHWEEELSRIIFIQGWTDNIIDRLGIKRINFAFLDAQHDKDSVMKEFKFVSDRQTEGDIVVFDDVTKGIFNEVCQAVDEIEVKFPYEIKRLQIDNKRGYAIATKIYK